MRKVNLREVNTSFLNTIKVTNKTHMKVLSRYHENKTIRIIVFIISFFTLIMAIKPYIVAMAFLPVSLEIFLYRYHNKLLKMYKLRKLEGALINCNKQT